MPKSTLILPSEWTHLLGARRAELLRKLMRRSGLPPEPLIDLALETLDIVSRKFAPSPISRTAVGLGAARWRNVDPEERSKLMRRAVAIRWAKHRKKQGTGKPEK